MCYDSITVLQVEIEKLAGGSFMPTCKITILKKTINSDLAKAYCQNEVFTCPCFTEGQEFIVGLEKPPGFCD